MTESHISYRIVRDDGMEDALTCLSFVSYDTAYDELERYYEGVCCSDDRIEYLIQEIRWINDRRLPG